MSALGGRGLVVGLRCNESRRRGSTRPVCCSVVLDGSIASVQPSASLLERSSVNCGLASGSAAASGTLRVFHELEGRVGGEERIRRYGAHGLRGVRVILGSTHKEHQVVWHTDSLTFWTGTGLVSAQVSSSVR